MAKQTKQQVNELWQEFRKGINSAYADASKKNEDNGICLRDYAEDISWNDALSNLLARETANERQHRTNRPFIPGFSAETAAKLILLNNAREGSKLLKMPRGTEFLIFRQTAAEGRLIGFLAQKYLSETWRDAIGMLDYAKLMQAA